MTQAHTTCGNGVITVDEECDDGNRVPGDGCSPTCKYEDSCACASGHNFICKNQPTYRGNITVCCPTLINPITNSSVCDCRGQASLTQFSQVTHDCTLIDIDECEINNGDCHLNAICSNVDGRDPLLTKEFTVGRLCICPEGFFGDGESHCDTQQIAANFILAIRNLTMQGNFLQPEWISSHILNYTLDSSWITLNQVVQVSAKYIHELTLLHPQHRRLRRLRRLQQSNDYDHILIIFEVVDWETLQQLTETLNTELIAEYLTDTTAGLNQILVLQSTTTSVIDSPTRYTDVVSNTPGFLVSNITYDLGHTSQGPAHLWHIQTQYYTPPGFHAILFMSHKSEGMSPSDHQCVLNTDVCCLLRTLHNHVANHTFGSTMDALIYSKVKPWCQPNGFPNTTAITLPTIDILNDFIHSAESAMNATHSLLNPDFTHGLTSTSSTASLELINTGNGGTLDIHMTQNIIANDFALVTQSESKTEYTFSIGMLFIHPLSLPALSVHLSQTRIQIVSTPGLTFTTTTNQAYTFLDFIDIALYEIEYRSNSTELSSVSRLQFVRVTMVLPAGMKHPETGLIPPTSIQITQGDNAEAWSNPCYSADNEEERDGSGLWDFDNGTKTRFLIASEAMCAINSVTFCLSQNETQPTPEENTLYKIDIPLGDTVITTQAIQNSENTGRQYQIQLRMMVTALKQTTTLNESNTVMVESQISTRIRVTDDRITKLCTKPINSVLKDSDFVSVSLSIGNELKVTESGPKQEIVFNDITKSPNYQATNVLDTGEFYRALSTVDSILTLVPTGKHTFFTTPEHSNYSVQLDSLVVVHLRNDNKHTTMKQHITNGTAWHEHIDDEGFHHVQITNELKRLCYNGYLTPQLTNSNSMDCVIETLIHKRKQQNNKIYQYSQDTDSNLVWLLDTFGDTPYQRQMSYDFSLRTQERFNLNSRFSKAWWILPTFAWPYVSTVRLNDKTLLFTAFAVDRNLGET